MQYKKRLPLSFFLNLTVQPLLLPFFQSCRLALGQVGFHFKIGLGQVQSFPVIHSHFFMYQISKDFPLNAGRGGQASSKKQLNGKCYPKLIDNASRKGMQVALKRFDNKF